MINRDGLVKLIDFGSARAAGLDEASHKETTLTPNGAIETTPPEYVLGEPASRLGDIFALGVLAYELLTGRTPYGDGFATQRDVNRRAYVPARQWRDDIPVWVDAALAQAVAKRPADRTEALSALVENLRRPNPSLDIGRSRPLLERNPAGFWRLVCLIEAVAILVLAVLLARRGS
jgi:eukaryotic-like serine/threonine-protein kinase